MPETLDGGSYLLAVSRGNGLLQNDEVLVNVGDDETCPCFSSELILAHWDRIQGEFSSVGHPYTSEYFTVTAACETDLDFKFIAFEASAPVGFLETSMRFPGGIGATVLEVFTTNGMTAGDNIGIRLANGQFHWDTIASVDTFLQITITTGLPSASFEHANVFVYKDSAGKAFYADSIIYASHDPFSADQCSSKAVTIPSFLDQEYFIGGLLTLTSGAFLTISEGQTLACVQALSEAVQQLPCN